MTGEQMVELQNRLIRAREEQLKLERRCSALDGEAKKLAGELGSAQAAAERERERRHESERALAESVARVGEELRDARDSAARLKATLERDAGWIARLPDAMWELTRLAAGTAEPDNLADRAGQTIRDASGPYLLSVEILDDPEQRARTHTEFDSNRDPICTTVQFGGRTVVCKWRSSLQVADEAVAIVQDLCRATLLSLAGVDNANVREERGIVTQLGDELTLNRHLALRERLGWACERISIRVTDTSRVRHRELFGQTAWNAMFADVGAALEEIAHRCGGQSYQVDGTTFCMLVDLEHGLHALAEAEERLSEYEFEFDIRAGA